MSLFCFWIYAIFKRYLKFFSDIYNQKLQFYILAVLLAARSLLHTLVLKVHSLDIISFWFALICWYFSKRCLFSNSSSCFWYTIIPLESWYNHYWYLAYLIYKIWDVQKKRHVANFDVYVFCFFIMYNHNIWFLVGLKFYWFSYLIYFFGFLSPHFCCFCC